MQIPTASYFITFLLLFKIQLDSDHHLLHFFSYMPIVLYMVYIVHHLLLLLSLQSNRLPCLYSVVKSHFCLICCSRSSLLLKSAIFRVPFGIFSTLVSVTFFWVQLDEVQLWNLKGLEKLDFIKCPLYFLDLGCIKVQ